LKHGGDTWGYLCFYDDLDNEVEGGSIYSVPMGIIVMLSHAAFRSGLSRRDVASRIAIVLAGSYFGDWSRFWTGGVLVSFIGSLDQFDLSIILQRIESYKKTGLLVVKQSDRTVELSFRQGQLLCIGPVRPDISLGERLLQAGVISQEAYREVVFTLGAEHYREVGAALTLIDLGHVNLQSLYSWASAEASRVIEALISWVEGDIYFEENQQPPSDRLLIALPISSLLPEQVSEILIQPVNGGATPVVVQQDISFSKASVAQSGIPDAPTMHGDPTPFDDTTAISSFAASLFASVPDTERNTDALASSTVDSLLPPQRVTAPLSPMRVNIAYMQPQMVLTPVDLSAYREQNPQLQFTPDQWRLFTRADAKTTLQIAAQELGMSRDQICQVAGELVALGIITLSLPAYGFGEVSELSPVSREYIQAGLSNGMMTPGYATSSAQPWDAVMPVPNPHGQFSAPYPVETHSQWGNGGNGATFLLGNGWVVAPPTAQHAQPVPINQYEAGNRIYAKAG
jgi:Domain of unknown function (DUF4388)